MPCRMWGGNNERVGSSCGCRSMYGRAVILVCTLVLIDRAVYTATAISSETNLCSFTAVRVPCRCVVVFAIAKCGQGREQNYLDVASWLPIVKRTRLFPLLVFVPLGSNPRGVPAPDCVEVSLSCPWISHCAGGGVVTYRLPRSTILGAVLADFCHLAGERRVRSFFARLARIFFVCKAFCPSWSIKAITRRS